MKIKSLVLALGSTVLLAACANTGGHPIRHDKRPGGAVDEKAYGITYPLCFKTDPKALRLLNEDAGDGLRVVVWTRPDGTERKGTWFMSKPNDQAKPPEHLVRISFDWPTIKNNIGVQLAAAMVFAHSATTDEDTPHGGNLSQYTACSK